MNRPSRQPGKDSKCNYRPPSNTRQELLRKHHTNRRPIAWPYPPIRYPIAKVSSLPWYWPQIGSKQHGKVGAMISAAYKPKSPDSMSHMLYISLVIENINTLCEYFDHNFRISTLFVKAHDRPSFAVLPDWHSWILGVKIRIISSYLLLSNDKNHLKLVA